jgi:Transposase DDE domain
MDDIARNWEILVGLLPEDWRQQAKSSGAVARLRGFATVESLLRCLLLHVGCGYSLRETAVRAGVTGLAQVSDVTLLNRLRQAEGWLQQMCVALLREGGISLEQGLAGRVLRVLDGTHVKEPGKTGTQWRVHYSLQLPSLSCDHFAITAVKGKGNHEKLDRFPAHRGELLLADRGFCRAQDIAAVCRQGADVLVRFGSISMVLYRRDGERFDWLAELKQITQADEIREWPVWIEDEGGKGRVEGRLCAIRKSEEAIQRSQRKLRRRGQLQQHKTRRATLASAAYIIVFTTLPAAEAPAEQVLECYRLRWQIELVFKRLKTMVELGHIPKHDEQSSHAWLYGKLLVALLSQKLRRLGATFSPWGYPLRGEIHAQPMA